MVFNCGAPADKNGLTYFGVGSGYGLFCWVRTACRTQRGAGPRLRCKAQNPAKKPIAAGRGFPPPGGREGGATAPGGAPMWSVMEHQWR